MLKKRYLKLKQLVLEQSQNKDLSEMQFDNLSRQIASLCFWYDGKDSDENGNSLLHLATYLKNYHATVLLLQSTQDLQILHRQNNDGNSLLHLAVLAGCESLVRLFIEAGVNQTLKNNCNQTAISLAVHCGLWKIAQIFKQNIRQVA